MSSPSRTPQATEAYNDLREVQTYSRHTARGLVAYWERRFVQYLLPLLGDRPAATVLDLGTGPGWIPVAIARARPDWHVAGLDTSPLMLEQARHYARQQGADVDWLAASADATGWPDASCDAVISHFALHEFPDPAAVLQETARLLKPGGLLLWHDLCRPPAVMQPLLTAMQWLLTFSRSFTQQYSESLRAAYRPPEVAPLLDAIPVTGRVHPIWGGSQIRVQGIKDHMA